jgi:hypothetical protein
MERNDSNLHRRPFFIELLSRPDVIVRIGIDDLGSRPSRETPRPSNVLQARLDGCRPTGASDQISRSGSGHEAQRDDATQHRIRLSNEDAGRILSRQCDSDTTWPAMSLLISRGPAICCYYSACGGPPRTKSASRSRSVGERISSTAVMGFPGPVTALNA